MGRTEPSRILSGETKSIAMAEFPCPYGCGVDLPPGDGSALEEHLKECSRLPKTGDVFSPPIPDKKVESPEDE